jgi:hypothetical protein
MCTRPEIGGTRAEGVSSTDVFTQGVYSNGTTANHLYILIHLCPHNVLPLISFCHGSLFYFCSLSLIYALCSCLFVRFFDTNQLQI